MPATLQRATLDDLLAYDGKAELIGGRIVPVMPTGHLPTEAAQEIFVALRAYAKSTGRGIAKGDGIGYAVSELPSGRESFSPDASYFVGSRPANTMRFLEGAPIFAVEVRSENDYSSSAEIEIAAKRIDYFAAGTLVVWDVDPIAEAVSVYRPDDSSPAVFQRGDSADAEPAVPGWHMAVDDIFPN